MKDTRKKNAVWSIESDANGDFSWSQAQLAVLMDIRDELQVANQYLLSMRTLLRHTLGCQNFIDVTAILRRISKNTTKPRVKKGVQ